MRSTTDLQAHALAQHTALARALVEMLAHRITSFTEASIENTGDALLNSRLRWEKVSWHKMPPGADAARASKEAKRRGSRMA